MPDQFTFSAVPNQVESIVKSMASNKAPGIDKVPVRVIKDCLPAILPSVTSIINATFESAIFPNMWKIAVVTPIPKEGDDESRIIIDLYHYYLCYLKSAKGSRTISSPLMYYQEIICLANRAETNRGILLKHL